MVEFVLESDIREEVQAVYREVSGDIASLLSNAVIEHIGGTAVPGALTKGDLDLCVLVDPSAFAEADRLLSSRFARNSGSDQTSSFSSFVDPSRRVPVGIQLAARGGPEDFFLRWKDLLRETPAVLDAYNELQKRWHGRSEEGYRAEKAAFIEDVLRSAGHTSDAG